MNQNELASANEAAEDSIEGKLFSWAILLLVGIAIALSSTMLTNAISAAGYHAVSRAVVFVPVIIFSGCTARALFLYRNAATRVPTMRGKALLLLLASLVCVALFVSLIV